jgi:uncharacterized repeat protein (TIGR01451 family)
VLTSLALIMIFAGAMPARAQAIPTFSKSFNPSTIGPGSVSVLRFDIANPGVSGVTDLAFTDVLPAGMAIANPASAFTTCTDAFLSAPDGGTTIALSGGRLPASSACVVSVNVTATATGVNTSGDLTSSGGNSGPAVATLTVDNGLPGFSKSFSPSTISLGGTSTLTLTVDNSANAAAVYSLNFVDLLPPGMVVATPSNASTDCENPSLPATLTAASGTNLVQLFAPGSAPAYPTLAADSTCTVTVDVTTSATGNFANISGPLLSGPSSEPSGIATASLSVPVEFLGKSFTDDPVNPGGTVNLEFTITNLDRNNPATDVSFTDDLEAVLPGLTTSATPIPNVCGAGSSLDFLPTGLLRLTGGSLPVSGSCSFDVALDVPAAAPSGAYVNTTSAITMDIGGSPVVGNTATDTLIVNNAPVLTKEFVGPGVGGGHPVTLTFTVTNSSTASGATDIEFIDELTTFLPFPVSVSLPSTPCGAGSTMALISLGSDRQGLALTGGNLGAGESCVFDVGIDVPIGMPTGSYVNVTTPVVATVGGEVAAGFPAFDILEVVGGPRLLKEFTDDPAVPGGTVNLEFTLTHDPNAAADANGIAFTDDLDAVLPGLTATGLPASDICGPGSQISGTSSLSFTAGILGPGDSCTFNVPLQVPALAPSGPHTNVTSQVTASVVSIPVTEYPASDDLMIAGLDFSKQFTDDPAFPGGTVTLEFTIENISPIENATGIQFTDDLDSVFPGLAPTGLPSSDICGAGSSLSATGNTLFFTGGSLLSGESCTFSVVLDVPGAVASDSYPNVTSDLFATMNGVPVFFPPAADVLVVSQGRLAMTKEFTDDPVLPGGTANLEFTISNLDPVNSASAIAFTDDLDAALNGLAATGLPMNDVCGAGSQISGAGLLSFTGGVLPAGGTCSFSVPLQVPGAAAAGAYTNITSQVTGSSGGFPITGDPASDDLLILSAGSLSITKSFTDDPISPGDTVNLEFTITNLDGTSGATEVAFTDDLEATLSGLAAVGPPLIDVCGTGSQLAVAGPLSLTGGAIPAGGACTFSVTLQVPATAPGGAHTNVTSQVTGVIAGIPIAGDPAADDLVVNSLVLSKVFGGVVPAGETTTLTFTIDNLDVNTWGADISFTDDLDAVVPGMVAVGLPAADLCGPGSLLTGTSLLTLNGGNVSPGGSCIFTVEVEIPAATPPGSYLNTTSEIFEVGVPAGDPATADLEVEPAVTATAIPTTSSAGILILIALIGAAALWRLKWSV